jgi:hypothetical protein
MPGPGTWSPGDVLTAADLNAIGTWTSYTPTLTQSVTRTATVNYAKSCVINKLCAVNVDLTCTTTGSLATVEVSLPFTGADTRSTGSGFFFDSSASTTSILMIQLDATKTKAQFYADGSGALLNTTLGNNDVVSFSFLYEVA